MHPIPWTMNDDSRHLSIGLRASGRRPEHAQGMRGGIDLEHDAAGATKLIQELEDMFGMSLFQRHRKGIVRGHGAQGDRAHPTRDHSLIVRRLAGHITDRDADRSQPETHIARRHR